MLAYVRIFQKIEYAYDTFVKFNLRTFSRVLAPMEVYLSK